MCVSSTCSASFLFFNHHFADTWMSVSFVCTELWVSCFTPHLNFKPPKRWADLPNLVSLNFGSIIQPPINPHVWWQFSVFQHLFAAGGSWIPVALPRSRLRVTSGPGQAGKIHPPMWEMGCIKINLTRCFFCCPILWDAPNCVPRCS